MIILERQEWFLMATLPEFLRILEIKNGIYFLFSSALEFIMRHPEVEIVPPKYPPNSYVLL